MNRIFKRILGLTIFLSLLAPTLAQDATVQISLAEFLKLTSQALAPDSPDRSPIPFMFSQGDYRLSDEGDWVRVEAQVSLQVYETGWTEVPLLPQELLIESARLDNKSLTLYPKDGKHTFCLKSAGRHHLTLIYYLKQTQSNSRRSVQFLSPATTVTNLKVVLEGKNLKLDSSPATPLTTIKAPGRTVVEGTVPSGSQGLTLTWLPRRQGQAQEEKPKLYARTYAIVTPGEREIQTVMKVDFTILHNEVRQLRFRLPAGVNLDRVDCPGLADWDLAKDGLLTLNLDQAVSGQHSVDLVLEKVLSDPETAWDVPLAKVESVERIKASVGLASRGGLELVPVTVNQARAIDVRELPPELTAMNSAPLLLAYESHQQPQQITLKTVRGEQVSMLDAVVDLAQGSTLVTPDGKVCTAFSYELRNTRQQYLTVTLPEDCQLWSCFVDDKPVKPVRGEDGLRIPLPTDSGTRTITARLVYVQQTLETGWFGTSTYQAPRLEIPISATNWTLYLPDDREITAVGGSMNRGFLPLEEDKTQYQTAPNSATAKAPSQLREMKAQLETGRLQLDNEKMSQMLQETSRGAFPVEVQIPESGQALAFNQILLTGETATVRVNYLSSSLWALLPLGILVCLLCCLPWLKRRALRQPQERMPADVD